MTESESHSIRVLMPYHLRTLAQVEDEITIDVSAPPTLRAVLDAIEARFPMLRGTIRDQVTEQRRPFLRFFACDRDFSNEPAGNVLPAAVVSGVEPLLIIGALAGG